MFKVNCVVVIIINGVNVCEIFGLFKIDGLNFYIVFLYLVSFVL